MNQSVFSENHIIHVTNHENSNHIASKITFELRSPLPNTNFELLLLQIQASMYPVWHFTAHEWNIATYVAHKSVYLLFTKNSRPHPQAQWLLKCLNEQQLTFVPTLSTQNQRKKWPLLTERTNLNCSHSPRFVQSQSWSHRAMLYHPPVSGGGWCLGTDYCSCQRTIQ